MSMVMSGGAPSVNGRVGWGTWCQWSCRVGHLVSIVELGGAPGVDGRVGCCIWSVNICIGKRTSVHIVAIVGL